MRKNGFTLAETLITLGIVGVAAALISPSMSKLIPSREKMEFMECYKQITSALPAIDFSPKEENYKYDPITKKIIVDCHGLDCVDKLGEEIQKASGAKNYTWSDSGNEATCKSAKSGKTYNFYLSKNATIIGFDETGEKFMKDQFNYYKKGDENEEE